MTRHQTAAASTELNPPAAIPVLAIAGLSLAALASGISLRLTDAMLPRLAAEFSVSLGQASQVITVFAVAYGLSQLIFGPMGDRFGKYRVIAWACAASALTSLGCALATGHDSLLFARLLAGASAAAVIPLSMAWIGDAVPYEQRQPVLARFLIGQITGFASGIWFGGYAADHLDWRLPFVLLALLFLAVAVALQLVRRRLPPGADRHGSAGGGRVLGRMVDEFRAILGLRWARVVLLTVFFEGTVVFGPLAFLASHLHLRLALSLSSVGAMVMLFAAGGLLFASFARTLVRRLGERVLVTAGAALMAVAMLLLAGAPVWWWAPPACAIFGLGFYMMHNTLQTHATQMAPTRRGAAVATFASSFFLGQSVGVGVAGLLLDHIGSAFVLAAGAVGVFAVALNFNRLRTRQGV